MDVGRHGRREPGGRLESVPTPRPRSEPWARGSGGARAGSGRLCCGCCAASRSTCCRVRLGRDLSLEAWKARALAGLELGLKAQAGEPLAAELDAAKRHIGELSMDNELLRERARAAERRLPLSMQMS